MTSDEIKAATREELAKEVEQLQKKVGMALEALAMASRQFPEGDTRAAFIRLEQHLGATLRGEKLPVLLLKTGQEVWS